MDWSKKLRSATRKVFIALSFSSTSGELELLACTIIKKETAEQSWKQYAEQDCNRVLLKIRSKDHRSKGTTYVTVSSVEKAQDSLKKYLTENGVRELDYTSVVFVYNREELFKIFPEQKYTISVCPDLMSAEDLENIKIPKRAKEKLSFLADIAAKALQEGDERRKEEEEAAAQGKLIAERDALKIKLDEEKTKNAQSMLEKEQAFAKEREAWIRGTKEENNRIREDCRKETQELKDQLEQLKRKDKDVENILKDNYVQRNYDERGGRGQSIGQQSKATSEETHKIRLEPNSELLEHQESRANRRAGKAARQRSKISSESEEEILLRSLLWVQYKHFPHADITSLSHGEVDALTAGDSRTTVETQAMQSSAFQSPANMPILPLQHSISGFKYKTGQGYCLVISYDVERQGNSIDLGKISDFCRKLNINMDLCRNMSKTEVEGRVEGTQAKFNQSGCPFAYLMVVIMAHGETNESGQEFILAHFDENIQRTEAEHILIQTEVVNKFDNDACPGLRGKPKLFMVQACRGGNANAITINKDGAGGTTPTSCVKIWIPSVTYILGWNSSVEHCFSTRDPIKGSWFIENALKEISSRPTGRLLDAIHAVNEKAFKTEIQVGNEKTFPVPCVAHYTLRADFYFQEQ